MVLLFFIYRYGILCIDILCKIMGMKIFMLGFYLSLLNTAEEKSKFEELYGQYENVLYNYAYRILKDRYLAEDAVHNAFLSVIKNFQKINAMSCNEKLKYLLIIVRNASFSIIKANNKNSGEDIDEAELITPENIESKIESDSEKDRIFCLLKQLSPIYSDALVLKLYYEMSDIEIAEALDISIENARVRVYRGRKKLRKLIEEDRQYDRY